MPLVCDKRATQQVKIYINKLLKNKHSLHKDIAKIITSFSHSSVIHRGSMFEKKRPPEYFIVGNVYSPFWVFAVHLPSIIQWSPVPYVINTIFGHLAYVPDWNRSSGFRRKKIFSPFDRPYIKKRNTKYYFRAPFFLKCK